MGSTRLKLQVANFLTNLGVTVQTQTLTSANLAADYASNAFNIDNNLVIYSSGGAQYFSPWVSAQQDCNVYGTPGCFNWFGQNAPDGLPHEEWPPYADAWYQSNLTAINNTPATNIHWTTSTTETISRQFEHSTCLSSCLVIQESYSPTIRQSGETGRPTICQMKVR